MATLSRPARAAGVDAGQLGTHASLAIPALADARATDASGASRSLCPLASSPAFVWFDPAGWARYKPFATAFTIGADCAAVGFISRGRLVGLEFSNLPHDVAETLELVFVGITIIASLAILVVFGQWWQR